MGREKLGQHQWDRPIETRPPAKLKKIKIIPEKHMVQLYEAGHKGPQKMPLWIDLVTELVYLNEQGTEPYPFREPAERAEVRKTTDPDIAFTFFVNGFYHDEFIVPQDEVPKIIPGQKIDLSA